ncbi:MAG TPA: sodium-dependent transporter [Novosphingobium sp.]|nr:sodium-dependent transporter [Novosphingobium sp.]
MQANSSDTPTGDRWTSRLGFVFATAAAAIGLGSLWRFPYVAGANGGGAFVLVYVGFIAMLCVPLMIAEMSIGREGLGSVVGSLRRLVAQEQLSPLWRVIGWLSLAVPFFGLSYYSVVAGWALDYTREAVSHGFAGTDAPRSHALFDALIGAPLRQGAMQFAFIMGTATVVALGVQRGIEVVSRIKMTAMFVVLIGLVAYNGVTVGLGPAVDFLIAPDFSRLTATSLLTAMGQALFSTAIGAGVLMTYSAYLPEGVSIPRSAAVVAGSVVVISLMAGLAIFPIVLAHGLTPAEGPNLIFVTLPVAFGAMPAGRFISALFFGLITLGAFTTAVGMLEPVTAWLIERTRLPRPVLAYATALAVWIVGLPSLLSFSVLKAVHPLAFLPGFETKTFFDTLDFGIAECLLPLNALLIALFAGWALRRRLTAAHTALSPFWHGVWRLFTAFAAPLAILVLMADLLSH